MNDRELSVIAVDDDEALLGFLKRAFGGARSFVSFSSAPDFLARAELDRCDIVLVDINMPGGQDGLSLTRHIKRVAPQCDVVVITGAATLENAVAAIKAGAYDFLTKPFSYDGLEAAVDRCVEKRAISSELRLIQEAQAELSAAYSQLKSAERMKEAFLSVIGHELRTPLAKILGGLELLEGAPEAQRAALMGTAMAGTRELREVIAPLILYAASS
jgi:DNA-binding NtrC family response regulator